MTHELLEPWRPRDGEWDRAAAQHLFRRAGFGARPDELERAVAEGPERSLERLFEDHAAPELRSAIDPLLATGELGLLQAWWMALILEGGAPLRERTALVWHDLFATSDAKVQDVRLMHAQNQLFRAHALGDFRALLHAVARDPAMLVWLDGDSNVVGRPNENFARELLELFALGKGNYGESDVREAARAFSGWGTRGRAFAERAEHHDGGTKTLFGSTGEWDGDAAVELVLGRPACARHVARVLLEAFVATRIEQAWIEAVAEHLVANEWDLGRTLRTLLASRLFHSPAARRARIAGPVELVAVAARALDVRLTPERAARLASDMGQVLFRPPSVKGWDGGRAWIHSGSWIARHNALVELAGHADHARWLGSGDEREHARRLLERLLPEAAGSALENALLPLLRDDAGAERRTAALALVLTAPEFQLF